MDLYGGPWRVERPLGRVGRVEVSRYETATGVRLRLRHAEGGPEVFLDPLELEGLTRVRYKPVPVLPVLPADGTEQAAEAWKSVGDRSERLQNEFALVAVALVGGEGLVVRDMNGGLTVVLGPQELEALLRVRHMELAPLVDTSDMVALPEPDLDEE